jgi:signal transduction histidine kinase
MRRSAQNDWVRVVVLILALFAVVLLLSTIPFVRDSEQRLNDSYYKFPVRDDSQSKLVVVSIDDESLRQYGRWPWPRETVARLVAALDRDNAGVIGIDILFAEPQSAAGDAALANAIRASQRTILVDKIGIYPDGPRWDEPIEQVSRAALAIGHAQALLDADGVCRRFPAYELTVDGARWAFALEVAKRTDPKAFEDFRRQSKLPTFEGERIITAAPRSIPIFFGNRNLETISAAKFLAEHSAIDLKRRAVLVGFGPTELGDRLITPISGDYPSPGIEVHAQILDNVLRGKLIRPLPAWVEWVLLMGVSALVIGACGRWRGARSLGVLAGGALAIYIIGFGLLHRGWLVSIGPLLLAVAVGPILAYSADAMVMERSIHRQLRELRSWLSERDDTLIQTGAGLSWRLDLLEQLQTRLGSLYELHDTFLRSTQDCIGVFDDRGRLLLYNEAFTKVVGAGKGNTLPDLRKRLDLPSDVTEAEGEIEIAEESYAYRVLALPATSMSPRGGTVVRLTSLRLRMERDRARAEALGFVTHELRTPLVAIQGFSELMMRYPDSEAYARAPETIFHESKRLLALINSYLDVLRVDAGARQVALDSVCLNEVVMRVLDILKPLAAAIPMTLDVLAPEAVFIYGDEPLISGAVLNLIGNAIKYGRPETVISVNIVVTDEGEAELTIHNFGDPIAPDDLARVFDPYFRAPKVSREKTGWGLGLAFVKRIAEKHGATICAESSAERGTSFTIRFRKVAPVVVETREPA